MMTNSTLQVEPLNPSWIEAFIPLIKQSLSATAGRKCFIEVTLTFDSQKTNIVHWHETIDKRLEVNLLTRSAETLTRNLFAPESPEESFRRAVVQIGQQGQKLREELRKHPVGCRQLVLSVKEGRLAGVKLIESIPIRNQRQSDRR